MERTTFHIVTFGCQMNVRDSQWLNAKLREMGYAETDADKANIIILNTCSVREKPELKVKYAIGRFSQGARGKPDRMIAVLGCVARQLGAALFETDPLVRLVAGGDCIARVPAAIARLLAVPYERVALLDFSAAFEERELDRGAGANGSAFVEIMRGCDNFCSYCIVPFTRGRQKSRALTDVLAECQTRVAEGAREITLLGQNVNAWGMDNKSPGGFAGLLRAVAAIPGLDRLRFVTPHPGDMDAATVAAFAELPNLCPRIHLPAQAGSDRILKAMRRRYSQAEYYDLVERMLKTRPDRALSTDLIVGFPGETEEDFQETLTLMRRCGFMSSFSFCYSDRPGTRSALMPDKIPQEIKLDRLNRLQELQERQTQLWLEARIGARTTILLEGPSAKNESGKQWSGRDPWGAIVNVEINDGHCGDLVEVVITGSKKHSLLGEARPGFKAH